MSLLMNDVFFLQDRISDLLDGLIKDPVLVVASFFTLMWIHWPSACVLMIVAPFVALSAGKAGGGIAAYAKNFQNELGRIADHLLDLRKRFEFIRGPSNKLKTLT